MVFADATIDRLTVHYIGNKQNGGALLLSKEEQTLKGEMKARLTEALLSRFAHCHERYTFYHPSSLEYNEVYSFARKIFEDQAALYEQSVRMASHVFAVSVHPKIKPGELYVGYFAGIDDDGTMLDAVGIFKAETRTLFADMVPGEEDRIDREGV
ncbi:MAG TPA: nucleoid-associated protein [Puia sp.]|nr:nucleoid-associated protein [Puia sp.]